MLMTANISAVLLSSSFAFTSAPWDIKAFTALVSPASAARIKGECPALYHSAALSCARVGITQHLPVSSRLRSFSSQVFHVLERKYPTSTYFICDTIGG